MIFNFAVIQTIRLLSKPIPIWFEESDICFVTYARPQFHSYKVETLHAASIHEGAGIRPVEASLGSDLNDSGVD